MEVFLVWCRCSLLARAEREDTTPEDTLSHSDSITQQRHKGQRIMMWLLLVMSPREESGTTGTCLHVGSSVSYLSSVADMEVPVVCLFFHDSTEE